MNNKAPTRANVVVLKQLLNLIPRGMINRHALETGVEAKVRTISVDTAGEHDNKRAREVCATIQPGEIVVFDKDYVDFDHLSDLYARSVW